jgi:hypothetical protein
MNDQLPDAIRQHLPSSQQEKAPFNWLKILGIVIFASVISTLVAVGVVYLYLFPGDFKPVALSVSEEQALESKLDQLGSMQRSRVLHQDREQINGREDLQPERYNETDANREIILTERERAKLLIPLDEEFPILGGKTLKVTAGLELAYKNEKPIVALRGISLWGVPIPNAWLGNIKHVDLVQEFGDQKGFWAAFADGVEEMEVSEGHLRVKLKE